MTQKEMTATVFENKSENANAPVFKGTLMLDGKEYDIAFWNATNQDGTPKITSTGNKFMKGKIDHKLVKP